MQSTAKQCNQQHHKTKARDAGGKRKNKSKAHHLIVVAHVHVHALHAVVSLPLAQAVGALRTLVLLMWTRWSLWKSCCEVRHGLGVHHRRGVCQQQRLGGH